MKSSTRFDCFVSKQSGPHERVESTIRRKQETLAFWSIISFDREAVCNHCLVLSITAGHFFRVTRDPERASILGASREFLVKLLKFIHGRSVNIGGLFSTKFLDRIVVKLSIASEQKAAIPAGCASTNVHGIDAAHIVTRICELVNSGESAGAEADHANIAYGVGS